jgi:hypothetical protein
MASEEMAVVDQHMERKLSAILAADVQGPVPFSPARRCSQVGGGPGLRNRNAARVCCEIETKRLETKRN